MYNMKSYRSRLFVHLFASDPVDLTYYEFVNHIDLSENTQFDWMKKKKIEYRLWPDFTPMGYPKSTNQPTHACHDRRHQAQSH